MSGAFRWAGAALRWAYQRLPLSWETKMRIKRALFRRFEPIFGQTNAFRRWSAHELQSVGYEAETPPPPPPHPMPDPEPYQLYAGQVLAHASSALPASHVELTACAPPALVGARAIAFYLPQFHPIAENDAWWGRGFTEWTNVSKAAPQFLGHNQPRLPGELGFYDLRLPSVIKRQTELARLHGIEGFCFHHYWFSGRRLLQGPVDAFLADPEIDFPFCLCWANENWTRRWDGMESDVLLGQVYNDDNDEAFIRDLLPFLRDRRYICVDGRPLVVVYRPSLLPDCRRTLEHWRQFCRDNGVGELFLVMVQFDVEDPTDFGFDAAVEFPPHKLGSELRPILDELTVVNPSYQGYVVDYNDIVEAARQWPRPGYPMIRGVFPSWDNEARKPGRGYTFARSTPAAYQSWLERSIAYSRANPVAGESLVFINAWNEWGEGAYLEPDRKHGYAYLQATRDALEQAAGRVVPDRPGVAVVSHDAHPHGAQYLALNIARELRALRVHAEVVLLGDGILRAQYDHSGRTHLLAGADASEESMLELARQLRARGMSVAIANTTVSGAFVRHLRAVGMEVVSLIHELPGVITEYGLAERARDIATHASKVVFAARAVHRGFEQFAELAPDQVVIRPQGLYKRNRFRGAECRARARAILRDELGLPAHARIVLCLGYADARKGVDLFVRSGNHCIAMAQDVHFVWVGHPDLAIQGDIAGLVASSAHPANFHFVGRRDDTDHFYAGADLYALTSREDPYPSVVLEALDVGVPVVGFTGAGGLDGMVADFGALVPMADTEGFAEACLGLLGDDRGRASIGRRAMEMVESGYDFRAYVLDLLDLTQARLPRISAVVPNYNYAHLLEQRLRSIVEQRLPVSEIIVLDDASSDGSLDVLARLEGSLGVRLRVVASDLNSGSVFRQWQRGVELATGEYVWIAEADDLSAPEFLQTVMLPFADPSVVMSYCQSRQIDARGTALAGDYSGYTDPLDRAHWRRPHVSTLMDELEIGLAVKNTIPNVSAAVFRRDVLRNALAANIDAICAYRIAGDWLAYLLVLEAGSIAFAPDAFNVHRRHAGGVTIGSDLLPHLLEVLRVQQWIRRRHALTARTLDRARAYGEALYVQFGLADASAPTLASRADAAELLS